MLFFSHKYLILIISFTFYSLAYFSQPVVNCSNAYSVTVNGSCKTGVLQKTPTPLENPPISCLTPTNSSYKDTWFVFKATNPTATISISSTSGGLTRDIAFILYDAAPCTSNTVTTTTELACVNNVIGGGTANQTETCTVTSLITNNIYYIQVLGFNVNNSGINLNACINSPQSNDDPTDPTIIDAPSSSCVYTSANLKNATQTTCGGISNPSCGSYVASSVDVWFSVVVPASGDLFLQTKIGTVANLGIATYTGTPCSSLTEIGCSEANPEGGTPSTQPSIYVTGATPSSTVYVRVWNKNGTPVGTFSICATTLGPCGNDLSVGSNDYCEKPYAIFTSGATNTMVANGYAGSPTYTQDVPGDLFSASQTCAMISSPIYNAWYSFVASTSTVAIPITASSCDINVDLFEITHNIHGCCLNFTQISGLALPDPNSDLDGNPCTTPAFTWSIAAGNTDTVKASGLTVGKTYYMMVDYPNSTPCNFSVTGWAYSGVLPVDMLLFNATNENLKNNITWVTANEKGVKQYVLQKSKDGVNFEDFDWLASKGITTEKNTYYATDGKPYELTYYRIKIIYQQGNEKYTNIISVNIANSIDNLQSVYPNPTSSDLNFEYYLKHAGNIQVSLIDYAGKTAFDTTYQLTEGKNKLTLPMSSLENGVYILKVVAEKSGKTTYNKVVKN
ncbi:MAG: T9SS type A sorting domain-containing protein [Bacteroidia bacterium]|nr:T9SS type A sorting domain-containing protein [Bacteroidia bacterium]